MGPQIVIDCEPILCCCPRRVHVGTILQNGATGLARQPKVRQSEVSQAGLNFSAYSKNIVVPVSRITVNNGLAAIRKLEQLHAVVKIRQIHNSGLKTPLAQASAPAQQLQHAHRSGGHRRDHTLRRPFHLALQ